MKSNIYLELIAQKLSPRQAFVINELGKGNTSFSRIRIAGGLSAANLTGDIKLLRKRGLLKTWQSSVDRRITIVSLTETGKTVGKALLSHHPATQRSSG